MPEGRTPPEMTAWSLEHFREICRVKRFMERWNADAAFRGRVAVEPAACCSEYDLAYGDGDLFPLWDLETRLKLGRGEISEFDLAPAIRRFRRFTDEKARWRDYIRATCAPVDRRWRAWRQRQIERAKSELGTAWTRHIIFDTAAFEISDGCSVGCWFCGVSAPRLSDHFYHTRENARLFRGVLELMAELCGKEAARAQFLYWASDPLDNPDYEAFCRDFFDVIGEYPMFTTALAHKDLERTRKLIGLVSNGGFGIHRLSVLNLKLLHKIHAYFSPEEMGFVECVVQSNESNVVKSNAGRFRDRARQRPEILDKEIRKLPLDEQVVAAAEEYLGPATIACVSGFLLNLVRRKVQLISPCKARDRWPLGYFVHSEGRFGSLRDLRSLMVGMIEDHMPIGVGQERTVGFRTDLQYRKTAEGIDVGTIHGGFHFGYERRAAPFGDLGDLIAANRYTAGEIAGQMLERQGWLPGETYATLEQMFARGLLNEEPPADPVAESNLVQIGTVVS